MQPSRTRSQLAALLDKKDPAFWTNLSEQSFAAQTYEELLSLWRVKRRALMSGMERPLPKQKIKLAFIGGVTFYPMHELIAHLLEMFGWECQVFIGQYDGFASEILGKESSLHRFKPEITLLWPPEYLGQPQGALGLGAQSQIEDVANRILEMCDTLHVGTGSEILLGNFVPSPFFDPGAFRNKTLSSDWAFKRSLNLKLGLQSKPHTKMLDLEFLASRKGLLASRSERTWYESKLPCSNELMLEVVREISCLVKNSREPSKKILVTDLDDTLWGGVIGEVGAEGIELGETSPRGQAFHAFQNYLLSLQKRGVLLAIASKNNESVVFEALEKNPEMILRREHFVSFKINWKPKSDSLVQIARELNLGIDSFVFIDDNPAEIELVKKFLPEVTTLLLGPDPSDYVGQLKDLRCFEPVAITDEDKKKTEQYQAIKLRGLETVSVADMDAYLKSLSMEAEIAAFNEMDIPRVAQLVNKSNQFNLTTRRRSESELRVLYENPTYAHFSIRLKDRFGDQGLIAVAILEQKERNLEVDTWLMSCRVLSRQVEELTLNHIVRIARQMGCSKVVGQYLPTPKNGLVQELFDRLGFERVGIVGQATQYELSVSKFQPKTTFIREKTHDANRDS